MPQTIERIRLQNLRKLIDEAGGPAKAARLLDMEPSQLSQISGRNPIRNIGKKLARKFETVFHKPEAWLDASHDQLLISQPSADYNVVDGPDVRGRVPLISWVQAGQWQETIDNLQPGEADNWIYTTARVGKSAYALRVSGDSMTNPGGSPSFPDGTILILDPQIDAINGSFVIVRQNSDSECTFKQFVRDSGRFYLKPLNPRYPILEMRDDAVICGVLVQAVMNF